MAAATSWRRDGIPDRPAAWLLTTARRRAIDRFRRSRREAGRAEALRLLARRDDQARLADSPQAPSGLDDDADEGDMPIADDQLRLMFTCCHPALALPARVALTLRLLGGLTTPEIARAFLVTEPTMAQRLVRAKRKIAAAGIPYRVPDAADLPERVDGVLAVLYLIYNAGHGQADDPQSARAADLSAEAIRLARIVVDLLPGNPDARGLLALLLLTESRRAARRDAAGRFVPLDEQDRRRWDTLQAQEGRAELRSALRAGAPGRYQLQAAIAAVHSEAHAADLTDWAQIAALYEALARLDPSPVVTINRAVAVARAGGDGLALLAALTGDPRLANYQPLHAARADLLRRAERLDEAARAYREAIRLSTDAAEQAWLAERLASVEAPR